MRISLRPVELAGALHKVTQTVYDNPNRPILGTYRIHASEERIEIAGTDLEITAVAHIVVDEHVRVHECGYVAVEGEKLDAIVRECGPGELLALSAPEEDGEVEITISGALWRLRSLPAKDYPSLPEFGEHAVAWDVGREHLLAALRHTAPFVAQDDARRHLTMVMFQEGYALATNGVQCGAYRMEVPLDGLAIPRGALKALMTILVESEHETVCIQQQASHLLFVLGEDRFAVRLLDVTPPNLVGRILGGSGELPCRFTVNREAFMATLSRAYVIRNEAAGVFIHGATEATQLEIATSDERGNRSFAWVEMLFGSGNPPRGTHGLGVNAEYLCNILDLLADDELHIRYGTELVAGKRPPIRIEEGAFIGVLMQLRFAETERQDAKNAKQPDSSIPEQTG